MLPGPSFVIVARSAIGQSRLDGLASALGMGIGGILFASLALAGLYSVLQTVGWLYLGLKLAGGAYLLYMSYKIWRGASQPFALPGAVAARSGSARKSFWTGLATQMSNPKTAIWYGSIFAALLPQQPPAWVYFALPPLVFLVEFGWYAIVALCFGPGAEGHLPAREEMGGPARRLRHGRAGPAPDPDRAQERPLTRRHGHGKSGSIAAGRRLPAQARARAGRRRLVAPGCRRGGVHRRAGRGAVFPLDGFAALIVIEGLATLAIAKSGVGGQRVLRYVKGLFVLTAGVLVLAGDQHGHFVLSMIFGLLFLVDGLMQCIAAYVVRYARWRYVFASGVAEILLAIFFFQPYPTHYVGTVPYCVGLFLAFSGFKLLVLARRVRTLGPIRAGRQRTAGLHADRVRWPGADCVRRPAAGIGACPDRARLDPVRLGQGADAQLPDAEPLHRRR